jgi:hypothetical protein
MKLFARNLRCSRRAGILVLLPLLAAGGIARAHTSKPSPSPGAGADTAPRFNIPIPIDHNAKGVDLPFFDNGKLQMYFVIRKAFRVDINHLDMTHAYMQTYDDKETPDVTIYMTRCLLDLNTRVITSEVPVDIRRSDFEITGQKMVFNTQTHVGRLSGHVQMTIYNRQTIAGGASPSPSPASPATHAAAVSPSPAPKPGATP